MSKRVLFVVIATVLLGSAVLYWTRIKTYQQDILSLEVIPTPTPRTTIPYGGIINLSFQSQKLRIYWTPVASDSAVYLIPNYAEKKFADVIARDLSCHIAINGGFYKGDGKPLGLLITNGDIQSLAVKSSVANGYFWQKRSGERFIGKTQPDPKETEFAIQSGPYMDVSNRRLPLANDERARRSLLGVDENENLYVISVTTADNAYGGAYLSDIPVIFSDQKVQNVLPVTSLLNLDGGGASFYYIKDIGDEFILSPLSPVGSVICVRM